MVPFENVFYEIGALLGVAAAGGVLAILLRQPLIVAFIAVGIIVGPTGFGWVVASDQVDLLAKLGIALLLFVVGLKLDPHIIRTMGPVALATGLGQVVFTSVVGYLIALALGMAPVSALYVAVALTFSSTIIIVKLLSDKREVDSLHGRIAIGFLIVQDIMVVLVMIGLTAFGQAGDALSLGREALLVLAKGAAMLAVVGLLMRYVLPPSLHRLARSPELLVLFSIAWAILGASAGDTLGFSKEVGAFLAGVSIAATPYRELVAARLVSLRDFLLLFFFIDLGASLNISTLGAHLEASAVLSLFVLIGNPFIVMAIMGAMGYRKRTGFLAGLTVAQISEFSLILGALGLNLGHIDQETMGLITLVGLITISLSTYMILYSHPLYERLAPWLGMFERKVAHREEGVAAAINGDTYAFLFGLGRFGAGIAQILQKRGCRVLAVDFDPDLVRRHAGEGYMTRYGDAEDPEFVASLPLERVPWVVSTVRERSVNRTLLHTLRQQGFRGRVAVAANGQHEAELFRREGADLVLVPYFDAAREAVDHLLELGAVGSHPGDSPKESTGA
ncbi:sodium/hydrogen exchanger [Nitrosococcus halophilus Nc 4]|uniref:Sodium/hydrogen exchanger n=1 Tax=Nitrosococcus halophilus (strain Nc4) TaxID=472759 RepID=D5C358_NITHN|nr:cation:proton antiporter family protein [Nitrosococcus halophilus]ADE14950.1 sodium/hydrogen exchanger [Nitrosococcus halophilus Nc 4]ADE14966.1 sodium/hydrogen exchanger [Nitrosococcus halophilus Nc 4]